MERDHRENRGRDREGDWKGRRDARYRALLGIRVDDGVACGQRGGRYTVTHGRREHPRLDTLTLTLLALLVLYGDSISSPVFLDAAFILALLAFLGTLAAARHHGEK